MLDSESMWPIKPTSHLLIIAESFILKKKPKRKCVKSNFKMTDICFLSSLLKEVVAGGGLSYRYFIHISLSV